MNTEPINAIVHQPMNTTVHLGNWHPDPYGYPVLRWHDGQEWTPHTAPMPTQQPVPQAAPSQIVAVNIGGNRGRCNHVLHFVMTILTGGLWLPVWILCAILANSRRSSGGINIR